ncbi:hypothetical protein [Azospirillum argentinense]|nr:hypothetical protein [Azospirillum argentinense]
MADTTCGEAIDKEQYVSKDSGETDPVQFKNRGDVSNRFQDVELW